MHYLAEIDQNYNKFALFDPPHTNDPCHLLDPNESLELVGTCGEKGPNFSPSLSNNSPTNQVLMCFSRSGTWEPKIG